MNKKKSGLQISAAIISFFEKVVRFNAVFANNRYRIKKKKGSRLL